MAGGLDNAYANKVLDATHDQSGAAVRLATAPIRVRFMTANGSDSAAGTELATSAGYTSGTGAPTVTFANAAGAGTSASNAAVTVTNMPAATVVGVEQWDSSGTPQRTYWGPLTASKTTNLGDTLSIASGALTNALA